MRSGARSGSDEPSSVEAGLRVGTSVKWRLAQPPRSKACSAPCDLRYARAGLCASFKPTNYPSARYGWGDMEKWLWLWAERTTSNRRKPSDCGRDVPSCVVTCPYPHIHRKISRLSSLVPWHTHKPPRIIENPQHTPGTRMEIRTWRSAIADMR